MVTQGHRSWCQLKAHMHFSIVINSNFGRIFYRFGDIDAFSSKVACFPYPTLVWCPLVEEALQYQQNLYNAEKYI